MAIGHGWDVHRLVPGRKFLLGGVEIPHPTGPLGHSDGDVLLHAVIDALLGAAGQGDIGRLFPDSDPSIKGISSETMLAKVLELLRGAWTIVNIDVTVIAEAPKIAPHRDAIRSRVATLTGCKQVNVKAKTNEGLGYVGAREAIECHAVAELRPA
ncbi:MAG TPA: 2-C-methyl-D-erythritol 2,4-cyclodiphosphate synthase [Planctomycetota bacterium]|jgi:2-C-methyl-D-erythritol 2,4-cyclodiphosphate synthase|nr:2-C-methyl-D-erythritol 2,4-cyclodiphosphate synthase [Planctomycetota bacterium]